MNLKQKKNKYLKRSHRCLNCDSHDIAGGFAQVDGGGASQDIHCLDCGSSWTDLYTLTDVVNIEIETEDK